MINDNDWVEYRALVLSELKRLDQHIGECDDNMREEVSGAKKELTEAISKLQGDHMMTDKEVRKMKAQMLVWSSVAAATIPYLLDLIKT